MAIKIVDATQYEQIGVSLSNAVLTFRGEAQIIKNVYYDDQNAKQVQYCIAGRYVVYANQEAYDNDLSPVIGSTYHAIPVTADSLNGNIINVLYSSMKVVYPSAVDC